MGLDWDSQYPPLGTPMYTEDIIMLINHTFGYRGSPVHFLPLTSFTLDIFVASCNLLNLLPMYDVVDNIRFYQPNAQCMCSAYTFGFLSLIKISWVGLGCPWSTSGTSLATPTNDIIPFVV